MRISSNQIFDTGSLGIINNQSDLYKLQSQLSSGRRILAPSDDPVAAAQALVVTQSKGLNSEYIENQGNAKNQLALLDGQLGSLSDLVQAVRERTIQAGGGALTNTDRKYIASELQTRFDELVSLSNGADGAGEFLFSGFQGATRPFSVNPANGRIAYAGDSGQRLLQVEASRQTPTNIAGDDLFMKIRNGNGTFQATTGGTVTMPLTPPLAAPYSNGVNQGTAKVDRGSVADPNLWAAAMNGVAWSTPANAGDLRIVFGLVGVAPNTTMAYQIYDNSDPANPVALLTTPANYVSGQSIPLVKTTVPAFDFGASVTVEGTPIDGDSLTIRQSRDQSLFDTVQNLITALNSPVGSTTYTTTEYANALSRELTNLDQAFENINRVRAAVGTGMKDIDALAEVGADKKLQYDTQLSSLQDLDYAKAISDFSRKQMQLEAAQKSFAQSSQLSLFSLL